MEEQIILELQDQLRYEKENNKKLQNDILEKQNKTEKALEKIADLNNKLTSLTEQYGTTINEKNSTIKNLEEDILKLKGSIEKLNNNLINLETAAISDCGVLKLQSEDILNENNILKSTIKDYENEKSWALFKRWIKNIIKI